MTEEVVEHGPKGGCVPEELREIRSVPTLMGEKDEEGKKTMVDFPDWYARVGVRTAEIDTGMGIVIVKSTTFTEKELEGPSGYTKLMQAIASCPAWPLDLDTEIEMGGGDWFRAKAGEPSPTVQYMLGYENDKANEQYVLECWPPSLVQQIMASQYYLRLPLISLVHPPTED